LNDGMQRMPRDRTNLWSKQRSEEERMGRQFDGFDARTGSLRKSVAAPVEP
jgi:hypothetical protein